MAELDVQPKKKTSLIPWLLLLAGIVALIIYFTSYRKHTSSVETEKDSATAATTGPAGPSTEENVAWNDIDFNAPTISYSEITNKDISVRGNDKYGIYGLGENILFDEGKAVIRPDAEANLKEIASSVKLHYRNGVMRIYGYTDSKGDSAANKKLSQERADAVKSWLAKNGSDAAHISVNAIGEDKPVAPNSTDAGRKQNRRVEIIARATTE